MPAPPGNRSGGNGDKPEPARTRAPESAVLLQLLGAAAGLAVFLTLVGAMLRRTAFEAHDLPADRAVGLIPREELLAVGVNALLPTVVYALGVVLLLTLLGPLGEGGKPRRWRFLIPLALLLVVPLIWQAVKLEFTVWPSIIAIVGAAAAGWLVIFLVSRGAADVRAAGWLVFVAVVAVGGVFTYVRTSEKPKLEPAALLRTGDEQGISGFLVAETSNAVYLAPLPVLDTSGVPVAPEREVNDIIEIPRDQLAALRVGPLAGFDEGDDGDDGPREARLLLEELRREDAAQRQATAPDVIQTDNPAETFAPMIHLHRDDPSYPTAADFFLANSWLVWAHSGSCPDFVPSLNDHPKQPENQREAIIGRYEPAKLGDGEPYAHPASENCQDQADSSYLASDHTRPGDRDGRPAGLPLDEGFFLDLWDSKQNGEGRARVRQNTGQDILSGVPVYYEEQGGATVLRITYWFFYPLSQPPGPRAGTRFFIHEGDWERISVLLRRGEAADQYIPLLVRYHSHDEFIDRAWAQAEKVADGPGPPTHPVGYSARGSHATYPAAGDFKSAYKPRGREIFSVKDRARACSDCPQWQTWTLLVDVTDEPWYGFGGAWGELRGAGGNGPLGPSPYKLQELEELAGELGRNPSQSVDDSP